MRVLWLVCPGLVACSAQPPGSGPSPRPEPPSTTTAGIDVGVGFNENMAHHVWLDLATDTKGTVTASCEAEAVVDEQIWAQATSTPPLTRVDLYGLLAETTYRCTLTSDAVGSLGAVEVTTESAIEVPGYEVTALEPGWGAWTLLNLFTVQDTGDQVLIVIDPEGRLRWTYPIGEAMQGGIEFIWQPEHQMFLAAGGEGFNPVWLDRGGTVISRVGDPDEGQFHHDIEPMGDTRIGALVTHSELTPKGTAYMGFAIQEHDMLTGELLWRWESQQAVDAGELEPGETGPNDRYHPNALSLVEDEDGSAWYVSLSGIHRIARVDRTTGSLTWQMGPGSEFSLLDLSGTPLTDADWFYTQHDPEFGPGRMLVHDNGEGRPVPDNYSRLVEYEVDTPSRTVTMVREYTQQGWYETVFGDADQLPNGNVLLTQGHCYVCAHGGKTFRSTLQELNADWEAAVWTLTTPGRRIGIYRAERVDRCEVFNHGGYCPENAP